MINNRADISMELSLPTIEEGVKLKQLQRNSMAKTISKSKYKMILIWP